MSGFQRYLGSWKNTQTLLVWLVIVWRVAFYRRLTTGIIKKYITTTYSAPFISFGNRQKNPTPYDLEIRETSYRPLTETPFKLIGEL